MTGRVILYKGDDHTLLTDRMKEGIAELVGPDDPDLLIDEFDGEDYQLSELIDAARTPPFFGDRRIIVARSVDRFSTADSVVPLVEYLADPSPTTTVVLGWVKGRVPKKLTDALAGAADAETIAAGKPRSGKAQRDWIGERLSGAAVMFDREAERLIADRIGQDLARLSGLITMLESTFGAGTKLTGHDIEPLLGTQGSVPPWELTDAIDRGNIVTALEKLGRMLDAGAMHELQVMRTLERHYSQMLSLDGFEAVGDTSIAKHLGAAPFTAKKLSSQLRRIGSGRVGEAIVLLGEADVDLRGRTAVPSRTTIEVLVARLARLSR